MFQVQRFTALVPTGGSASGPRAGGGSAAEPAELSGGAGGPSRKPEGAGGEWGQRSGSCAGRPEASSSDPADTWRPARSVQDPAAAAGQRLAALQLGESR